MNQVVEIDIYLKKLGPSGEAEVGIRDRRRLAAQLDMRSKRSVSRAFTERFARIILPALTDKEKEQREHNWRKLEEKRAKKIEKKRGRQP